MSAPEIGTVTTRLRSSTPFEHWGTYTIVLVRTLFRDKRERYSVLAVCSEGEYRYQTWTENGKYSNRERIRSYLRWPSAYNDWRMRK
jgi:hypothetical protein